MPDYKPIELFDNPAQLVGTVDTQFATGEIEIHPWQLRLHRDFAVPTTDKNPFRAVVRAANGSGKDKMCIAPCAVWLGTQYVLSNSIVTSSSGRQLDTQTEKYVRMLCEGVNSAFGEPVWKCNYRFYENTMTGSTIELFATDEPGKAEGSHPAEANRQMGIFVSEAKSIQESIFDALVRCTGFTKRMDVSSPGLSVGHFYDTCVRHQELGWKQYHVTAFDCPHLAANYAETVRLRYGEQSNFYKSMVLAEFGLSEGELIVLTPDKLHRLQKFAPMMVHIKSPFNTGGLDLSAGGDETVLVVRNGNKVIAVEAFRLSDTAKAIRHLESLFRKYELTTMDSPVYADAGGLGKPIIDQFRDRGWKNVHYVMNQWEPRDKIAYNNLGTENWFRLARLIEEMEIILPFAPKDDDLEKQLVQRFYKINTTNTFALESKIQAKAKGHPSPDRADALVLAFYDYKPTYLLREHRQVQNVPVAPRIIRPDPTLRSLAVGVERNDVFRGFHRQPTIAEMTRLIAETNRVNYKLKSYFLIQKLLTDKTNEKNDVAESAGNN